MSEDTAEDTAVLAYRVEKEKRKDMPIKAVEHNWASVRYDRQWVDGAVFPKTHGWNERNNRDLGY